MKQQSFASSLRSLRVTPRRGRLKSRATPKQQSLLPKLKDTRFGGDLLKRAHARTHRPLSTSKPVHLILKSSQAKGAKSFLNPRWMKRTRVTFFVWAQKCNIRILGFQNTGNHIHCLIQCSNIKAYQRFVRIITGRIAQVMGIKWDQRPFTRVVGWGRDFQQMKTYLLKNLLDAMGIKRTKENLAKHFGERCSSSVIDCLSFPSLRPGDSPYF